MLNSKQISEFVSESEHSKRTQAGIDLSVFKIEKIDIISNNTYNYPLILKDKTIISKEIYKKIQPETSYKDEHGTITSGWLLDKGLYSITFNEGINIPGDCMAKITQRSSLYRVGNSIETPWFDAGYHCDNINTTLIVNTPMFIEPNARLCQVVFYRLEKPADNLYNGQWQGLSSATK